ncbi:MAG: hypothetical protein NTV31_13995 [Bacteroidia bacterium]|nr:hypothetical protein [Bacteroidia bacterium]
MNNDYQIPEPFLFNSLKHHLGFIREFINLKIDESNTDINTLTRELKHLGTSVMDVYTGSMSIINICREVEEFLKQKDLLKRELFSVWAGINMNNFRIISLPDSSQWTLKYHNNEIRYVHLFPARSSPHSFRVKSNTLKSALIYHIIIGKDFITGDDLNKVRPLLGLSPVKDAVDTEAILEMVEILRG